MKKIKIEKIDLIKYIISAILVLSLIPALIMEGFGYNFYLYLIISSLMANGLIFLVIELIGEIVIKTKSRPRYLLIESMLLIVFGVILYYLVIYLDKFETLMIMYYALYAFSIIGTLVVSNFIKYRDNKKNANKPRFMVNK